MYMAQQRKQRPPNIMTEHMHVVDVDESENQHPSYDTETKKPDELLSPTALINEGSFPNSNPHRAQLIGSPVEVV